MLRIVEQCRPGYRHRRTSAPKDLITPDARLHRQQDRWIPLYLIFRADRAAWIGYRIAASNDPPCVCDRTIEVRANAVHLVHEADARNTDTCRPGATRFPIAAARRRPRQTPPPRHPEHANERSTSAVKSTWPGVSMMLMVYVAPFDRWWQPR